MAGEETELAFVARLRDEATRAGRAMRSNLDRLGGATKPITTGVRVKDEVSGPLAYIRGKLDSVEAGARRAAAGVAQAGKRMAVGFAAGVLAAGALGTAGVGAGLKTAAAMENADIAFTTMLGSARDARTFLGDLQQFAAKTPFEFPELQTAASSLVSAGIEARKVIPIMTTLGNVTSGMGTGSEGVQRATVALQQMAAAGRITGEDLNQLRDAGVPVFDLLSAATGKSKAEVVKLAQAGKLGAKELGQLMSALESGKGLDRFNGLMEKQSASLAGQFSTLKDTVNMTLSDLATPAIPSIKRGMGFVSSTIADAAPRIRQAVATGVGMASEWIGDLAGQLPRLVQAFRTNDLGTAAEALDSIFGDTGGKVDFFREVLTQASESLDDVAVLVREALVPAFDDVRAIMPSFVNPLQIARSVLGFMADNTGVTRVALVGLIGALALAKTITTAATIATKAKVGWDKTAAVTTKAWAAGQWILNAAMSANPLGLVVIGVAALAAGLVLAWRKSETFRNVVTGVFDAAKRGVGNAVEFILRALRGWLSVWLWVAGGIIKGAATALGWIPGLGDKLKGAERAFEGMRDGILDTLDEMADAAGQIGEDAARGVADGLRKRNAEVAAAARATGRTVSETMRLYLKVASPSKVTATIGEQVAAGLAQGMADGRSGVREAVRDLVGVIGAGMADGKITRGAHDHAVAALRGSTNELEALAARRARVAGQLARAETRLADIRKTRAEFGAAVRDAARASASIGTIEAAEGETLAPGNLVDGLRERLAAIRAFAANIAELRKRKLNAATLRQILDEGVEGGGDAAAALARASASEFAEINRTQGQIDAVTSKLGKDAGSSMYAAGEAAAAGLVRGLRASRAALAAEARALANAVSAAVRSALGIRSPSRVFAELGGNTVAGLVAGMVGEARSAELAASDIAARVAAAATVDVRELAHLAGVQAVRELNAVRAAGGMSTITRTTTTLDVVIRHEVEFRGDAPDGLTAEDVADVIARDPRSARRIEEALRPVRGKVEAGTLRPSR